MPYDATKDPYAGFSGTSVTAASRKLVQIPLADTEIAAGYVKQAWAYCPPDVAGGVGTVRVVAVGNADGEYVDIKLLPGLQPLPAAQLRRVQVTGTTAGVIVYGLQDK